MPVVSTVDYYANRNALIRMGRNERMRRARQQQRLARAANARAGYRTVARTRGVYSKGEMKYFDTQRASTALAATTTTWVAGTILDPATFNTFCAPTVGAAINQRIGREIKLHKWKIHGQFFIPAQSLQSTADSAPKIRLILVMDTQTNAAQMTSAQLMADGSAADTTINSFQNLANFGRFRVLKDKMLTITNPAIANDTGATGGVIQNALKRNFKVNYRFKYPVSVRFNATNGGSIADIVDNSLHLIVAADTIAMAPTISYSSRVCYKE